MLGAMERAETLSGYKDLLPLGTQVGPWRVVDWAGGGVHGAIYRAVRLKDELAGPVALKLALLPRDPRFAREAHLLSHLDHPNIPRLWEHGSWQHPAGTLHPYLAMEWVEGLPLYSWAQAHPPSSQQVLHLLAQLAGALQAVHALGAVHRDVKGANVLMRLSDGRAFLTDFGTGISQGAAALTPPRTPVGTPAYRSPEAWLFDLRSLRDPAARYVARPADDLFALGVTACRLLTGQYPDFSEPYKDANGVWQVDAVIPPAALLDEDAVESRLRAWVLRLLSPRPEQRGSAAELAEALAQATGSTVQETPRPLAPASPPLSSRPAQKDVASSTPLPPPQEPVEVHAPLPFAPVRLWQHALRGRCGLALTATGLALALWAAWPRPEAPVEPALVRDEPVAAGQADAGTVGLGDAVATAPLSVSAESTAQQPLAEGTLPEPLPGQVRTDTKGRCPHKRQVALNGACWVAVEMEREKCEALMSGRLFEGTCYVPVIPPGRPPTSTPGRRP